MTKIIDITDNIKFKVHQFFATYHDGVNCFSAVTELTTKQDDNYKLLLLLKRMRDQLAIEGKRIEETVTEIREPYITDGEPPAINTPEFFELDQKLTAFLNTEVEIALPRIKLSKTEGIKSLKELDVLEGIIEDDISDGAGELPPSENVLKIDA